MKKFKKFASVALAACMVAGSLAGCGAKGESNTFKFGSIGPLTGGAAAYGTAVMNSIEIAVAEINAAGGINGYQVEFKKADDEHNAEKSVNAYNSLKDWGMQVLVGTVTTAPCIAVADKTAEDNMFQLTPSASSTEVIKNDNVFQVCFTDPNQGIASADYISANFKDAKVGVLYNSADPYSSGIRDTFVKESAAVGVNIVDEEAFTTDSATDFTTQLQKLQSAGVDLLFYPYYYTEAAIILGELNQMGYAPTFFGVDGMDGILGVEGFDVNLAEGVYLLTPFAADATDDLTVNFVTTYQNKYKEIPNQFGADAYDCIYAIKKALEAANATPSMSVSKLNDILKDQFTKISVDGLTGEGMTWAATGEVNKAPKAVIIKGGTYVSAN